MNVSRLFLALASLFLVGCLQAAHHAERPNLVLIVTDDQGYWDVGFNGCTDIPTPNIDRIAHEGARFENGYVSYPVCGPSRAGFLTGRYQGRFGFRNNPTLNPDDAMAGLPVEEDNIAEVLDRVGYHSGIIGKWHMGTHPRFRPNVQGFDEFYGFVAGGHRYFPEDLIYEDIESVDRKGGWYNTKLRRNDVAVETDEYLTDELSNEAVDFIARNHADPFFLFVAYNAPHTPMQASEKYLKRFAHIDDELRRTYAAMVSAVDDGVGRILEELEQQGLDENTLVVFFSDNGGARNNGSINTPLRDNKGSLYEGGMHVPFAMRWTGRIPAGLDYQHSVSSLDVLGTMAGITGVKIAEDRPLDGVNLMPYLTGKKSGVPHEYLFWEMIRNGAAAVRHGDDKLKVAYENDATELFDLENDLAETQNLAEADEAKTKRLRRELDQWTKQLKPSQFKGLGSWDPAKNPAKPRK
ncbi:sulfatase-like hydrolase/transferase [Opitutaceae bacterium]|nr:sulfatase-like hydrolase/transferase [Opitutaceae bacterium]